LKARFSSKGFLAARLLSRSLPPDRIIVLVEAVFRAKTSVCSISPPSMARNQSWTSQKKPEPLRSSSSLTPKILQDATHSSRSPRVLRQLHDEAHSRWTARVYQGKWRRIIGFSLSLFFGLVPTRLWSPFEFASWLVGYSYLDLPRSTS
jgi:hypothetical protein